MEHKHHWKEKFVTTDGVDSFVGLECECGLLLTISELAEIVNEQANEPAVTDKAIKQSNRKR